jgi:integrase
MASYLKRGDSWRVAVKVNGTRATATFDKRSDAVAWADAKSAELRAIASNTAGTAPAFAPRTLGELLTRYVSEVSPQKAGFQWEAHRIAAMLRDSIASVKLKDLTPDILSGWRDRRLAEVSAGAVLRDMNLLSHALNVAADEWGWLPVSPLKKVRRPKAPAGRDRLVTAKERDKVLHCLGYVPDESPRTISARVGAALLFAIETGMRAGEIAALTWSDISGSVAKCRGTKTAAARRDVPLSPAALAIIRQLKPTKTATVFAVEAGQIDSHFRKATAKAGVIDLHFHDSRHTAVTALSRKLDVLALARMIGHRDLRMLQRYYNESAHDIAKRL